jgi:hypothetical protein
MSLLRREAGIPLDPEKRTRTSMGTTGWITRTMSNTRLVQLAVSVCVRGSHPQTIDADVLAPDVAGHPDDITLVGRDDRQAINN